MLLPVSAGPAQNGTMPASAAQVARRRANVAAMNQAALQAKNAVLGFCTSPGSYAGKGVNLVSDVAGTQSTLADSASVAAPGATISGAGGYSIDPVTGGPTVIPMGQLGLPPAPPYAPQTTQQGPMIPQVASVTTVPSPNPSPSGPSCNGCQQSGLNPTGFVQGPIGAPWGTSSATKAITAAPAVVPMGFLAIGILAALAVMTRGKG